MLLFLSGVGATVGLLLVFGAGYIVSKHNSPKAFSRPPTSNAEMEEERIRQKQIQDDFRKIWQYDVRKAYENQIDG